MAKEMVQGIGIERTAHDIKRASASLFGQIDAIDSSVSCLHCGEDYTSVFGTGSRGSILNGCPRCGDTTKGYVDLLIKGVIFNRKTGILIGSNDTVTVRMRCVPPRSGSN